MNKKVNISYKGVELTVLGDYTPEEPMVMYYDDMSGHPGSPAEFNIEEIIFNNIDVYDIYDCFIGSIEDIEELCLTEINEEYYD